MNAVWVLLPSRTFGGHERMLLAWLQYARDVHNLTPRVACAPVAELMQEAGRRGLVKHTQMAYPATLAAGWRARVADWRRTYLLARMARREGAVVLLAPGVVQAALGHRFMARLAGPPIACYVPMAFTSKQMGFRWAALRDLCARRVSSGIALWITITDEQRELVERHWCGGAPVILVPNCIDVGAPTRAPAAATAQGTEALVVLYAGRFDAHQKGLDWLAGWLDRQREHWNGRIRFVFQGHGPAGDRLRQLVEVHGEQNVRLRPWGDTADALTGADVLLLPSRFEGLPLVAIEAAEAGVAIVASRSAGLMQFVPATALFDFGDDNGLLTALTAMAWPAERRRVASSALSAFRAALSVSAFDRSVEAAVAALSRLASSRS